jgi:hypothetical protein
MTSSPQSQTFCQKKKYSAKLRDADKDGHDVESLSQSSDSHGVSSMLANHDSAAQVFMHLIEKSHNLLDLYGKAVEVGKNQSELSINGLSDWFAEFSKFFDDYCVSILNHRDFLPLIFSQKLLTTVSDNGQEETAELLHQLSQRHFFWLGTCEVEDEQHAVLLDGCDFEMESSMRDFLRVIFNSHLTRISTSELENDPAEDDASFEIKHPQDARDKKFDADFFNIHLFPKDPFKKLLASLIWALFHMYALNVLVKGDSMNNHNHKRLQTQHKSLIESVTHDCVMGVGLCLNKVHALDHAACSTGSAILGKIKQYSSTLFQKQQPYFSTLSPNHLYPHASTKILCVAESLKWIKYKVTPVPSAARSSASVLQKNTHSTMSHPAWSCKEKNRQQSANNSKIQRTNSPEKTSTYVTQAGIASRSSTYKPRRVTNRTSDNELEITRKMHATPAVRSHQAHASTDDMEVEEQEDEDDDEEEEEDEEDEETEDTDESSVSDQESKSHAISTNPETKHSTQEDTSQPVPSTAPTKATPVLATCSAAAAKGSGFKAIARVSTSGKRFEFLQEKDIAETYHPHSASESEDLSEPELEQVRVQAKPLKSSLKSPSAQDSSSVLPSKGIANFNPKSMFKNSASL